MADFDKEDVVLIGGKAMSRTIILNKLIPNGWTREQVAHMNDEEVRAALAGARPNSLSLAPDPARKKTNLKVVNGEVGKKINAEIDLLNEDQPAVTPAEGAAVVVNRPGAPRIINPVTGVGMASGQPAPVHVPVAAAAPVFNPHAKPAQPAPPAAAPPSKVIQGTFSPHAKPQPAPVQRPAPPPPPPPAPVITPPSAAPMSILPPGVPPCRYNHLQLRSIMDAAVQLVAAGDAGIASAKMLVDSHNLSDALRAYNGQVWMSIYGDNPVAHEWCLGGILMTIDGGPGAYHFVTTDGIITVHGQNLEITHS